MAGIRRDIGARTAVYSEHDSYRILVVAFGIRQMCDDTSARIGRRSWRDSLSHIQTLVQTCHRAESACNHCLAIGLSCVE